MTTTWLSDHFSLDELTVTRQPFDNTPPKDVILRLVNTAKNMEKVRALLQTPILVNSGYRSPRVNAAVGGSDNSDHMRGDAVDFISPRFGTPLQICRAIAKSGIKFDQLIEEGTWAHISFGPRMRQQVLTKAGKGFTVGLKK